MFSPRRLITDHYLLLRPQVGHYGPLSHIIGTIKHRSILIHRTSSLLKLEFLLFSIEKRFGRGLDAKERIIAFIPEYAAYVYNRTIV